VKYGFLALLLPISVGCLTNDEIKSSAERNAFDWGQAEVKGFKSASCVSTDSDADGYVSCTITTDSDQRVPVECVYDVVFPILGQPSGCKMQAAVTFATSNGQ
jgi:hypothetical protein